LAEVFKELKNMDWAIPFQRRQNMWEKFFKTVIRLFKSPVGKIIISGAIDEYVISNDNPMTKDCAKAMKAMLK
jgi:hypothetical protein